MKIKEALSKGIEKLKINNIEEASLKARMLLSHILKQNKEYLLIHSEKEIDEKDFFIGIDNLIKNTPIQYIINKQEFMNMEFYVDENVLIPQPDTEILVEEVIKLANDKHEVKILDLCTGSGCIAIALSKNIRKAKITATDISIKAIQIAKLNAERNLVKSNNISFIESDMFENIQDRFDIIVSNPPYIETEVIETLSEEVRKEPILALDGGKDGLKFYRQIAENAYKYLNSEGCLCLEIGYNQKEKVIQILENIKQYKNIYCKKDLGNNDRIIIAKRC